MNHPSDDNDNALLRATARVDQRRGQLGDILDELIDEMRVSSAKGGETQAMALKAMAMSREWDCNTDQQRVPCELLSEALLRLIARES